MQSLMWEEFLGSNVDCYMEASPRLLCTKITRGEGSCNLDEGKSFSVPMWFSTSRLVPDCFAQMLQEKIIGAVYKLSSLGFLYEIVYF